MILSVLDPRKCEYLKDYSLGFEHAYMATYLASCIYMQISSPICLIGHPGLLKINKCNKVALVLCERNIFVRKVCIVKIALPFDLGIRTIGLRVFAYTRCTN